MNQLVGRRMGVNPLMCWFGKITLKLAGWRTEGEVPAARKSVMIVAPHTSNWDFPIGLMASFALRIKPYWIGKHTLFRWPLGPFFRMMGGIAIDRRASQKMVQRAIQAFKEHEEFLLVLTPEGTRKKVQEWKTGFYHIAKGAQVPIICAFLDYRRKVVGIGPVITASGNMEADVSRIKSFYAEISAGFREKS